MGGGLYIYDEYQERFDGQSVSVQYVFFFCNCLDLLLLVGTTRGILWMGCWFSFRFFKGFRHYCI